MGALAGILALGLLLAVILVVTGPVRAARAREHARRSGGPPGAAQAPASPVLASAERGDLEAAREAKYREIRDVELDYRTGKLSRADYEAIDAELRAEALEILDRLEAHGGRDGAEE